MKTRKKRRSEEVKKREKLEREPVDRLIDRRTNKHTDRQTDRQKDRKTDRQTGRRRISISRH
jgi:hypothetical protein